MGSEMPTPDTFWEAVEIYLAHAYGQAPPSKVVQDRLASLRAAPADALYQQPAFERDKSQPDSRVALRLGNKVYPHMKLVIEHSPSGPWPLLRADTHDGHVAPAPTSPAFEAFRRLMVQNAAIAAAIEAAWTEHGLPTFKKLLKDDLARRAGLA